MKQSGGNLKMGNAAQAKEVNQKKDRMAKNVSDHMGKGAGPGKAKQTGGKSKK